MNNKKLIFFKNPIFWSAVSSVVAIIALIFSQLPPIQQMIKGTDVRITTTETIDLWHNLGNIVVNVFLDIHNGGGDTVNISRIECTVMENDTGKVFRLPARTYQSGQYSYSLGTITLNPEEHFIAHVNCFDNFTRSELEKVTDLRVRIQSDVAEKRDKLPVDERENTWIEIDNQLYQEAVDFFNKKYELIDQGNYRFFIRVISDSDETLKFVGFDFTLFDSNIKALQMLTEKDYRYASGILFRPRFAPDQVTIPIERMSQAEAEKYYEEIKNP